MRLVSLLTRCETDSHIATYMLVHRERGSARSSKAQSGGNLGSETAYRAPRQRSSIRHRCFYRRSEPPPSCRHRSRCSFINNTLQLSLSAIESWGNWIGRDIGDMGKRHQLCSQGEPSATPIPTQETQSRGDLQYR